MIKNVIHITPPTPPHFSMNLGFDFRDHQFRINPEISHAFYCSIYVPSYCTVLLSLYVCLQFHIHYVHVSHVFSSFVWWDMPQLYSQINLHFLQDNQGPCCHFCSLNQGPVVQSVFSLTSSLRVILLTVLADSIYSFPIFFAENIRVAFAPQPKATHIFSAKNFSFFAYHSI